TMTVSCALLSSASSACAICGSSSTISMRSRSTAERIVRRRVLRSSSACSSARPHSLGLAAFDLIGQVVHGRLPERSVVGKPGANGPQRLGVERVDAVPTFHPDAREALFSEYLQLLRDRRLG